MERLINRRQQGDLGEASAIEWLTRQRGTVFVPLGHSPNVDLIAEIDDRILRIQVKTSTYRERTPKGDERYQVMLATNGGNQSWTGVTKCFDPTRCDALFVLTGEGRRGLIPSREIDGRRCVSVGGLKYSEFEIAPTEPINKLVYGSNGTASKLGRTRGSVGVWRAERACKVRALALSEFESHLPHSSESADPRRRPGVSGQTRISASHQLTIPVAQFAASELKVGDRMRVIPDGPGRVILERIEPAQPALDLLEVE